MPKPERVRFVEVEESPRERGLRRVLDAFDMAPPREIVEVVEPAEPYWLDEDSNAVFEYLREEALKCPGCGLPRDETMSKEAEGNFVSRALRCHACAARDRSAKRFTSGPHEDGGLYHSVERL